MQPVTRLVSHYTEAEFGEPFVIVGSAGYLEVGLKQAHAGKALGVGVGAPIELKIG